jgi:site-specific DNA-methyltransferase (adenine-specific)
MGRRRVRSKVGLSARGSNGNGTQEKTLFSQAEGEAGETRAPAELDAIPGIDAALVQAHPECFHRGGSEIRLGDALAQYDRWPSPVAISVDGPYGVSGFPGDPPTPDALGAWYEPHIKKWSERSTPLTTLWFWNTEIGWANVHPILARHDWAYRGASVWDKGIGHIAGNVNTGAIRRLPVVTELCVHYVKEARFDVAGREVSMKEWLRHEWVRSGLPLYKTNEACGVINAATRKYFTQCHLWYYPPVEVFVKFVAYANEHGKPEGRPYFSLEVTTPLTGEEWDRMRAKFQCEHGVTNVWRAPAVRGDERIKNGTRALHYNQKPSSLVELTVRLCTDPGDVVWEPFGGLCTTAIACHRLGRKCHSAEIDPDFYGLAVTRLAHQDEHGS